MLNRSASLAMSTSVLKALPGKLDIKRHSPSVLYIFACTISFHYFVVDDDKKGLTTGAIVGIVFGIIVGVAAMIGIPLAIYCYKRKQVKNSSNTVI